MTAKNDTIFRLQISNFGPITKGAVDLKPLTIFIGPNNTGKSYLATLIYALFSSFRPHFWVRWMHPLYQQRLIKAYGLSPPMEKNLTQYIKKFIKGSQLLGRTDRLIKIPLAELPQELKTSIEMGLKSQLADTVTNEVARELRRCYGATLTDLIRKSTPLQRKFSLLIEQKAPRLQVQLSSSNDSITVGYLETDLESLNAGFSTLFLRESMKELNYYLLSSLLGSALGSLARDAYYLPAARSGILQGHRLLASLIISRSSRVGIEPIEVPTLPGVIADFMSKILVFERRSRETGFPSVIRFLEDKVVEGEIDIKTEKLEHPEIYYKTLATKLPLHRTSSMVSELAPIILFLKYVIDPGDIIIIEEPESHLHPEAQLKLARAIIKLVREKVGVLITTHSDYFLEQLSNLISLSQLTGEERIQRGFEAEDYLKVKEVGAYLFKATPEGSLIEPITVNTEDGISDEEFARVTQALYEETVYLHRKVTT